MARTPGSDSSNRLELSCGRSQTQRALALTSKKVLHRVVIARKIKSQHALARFKNESPRQTCAALVKMFAQLPYRQPSMRVRLAKTLPNRLQCNGNLRLPSGFPHNLFEPLGQFNGNHPCSR